MRNNNKNQFIRVVIKYDSKGRKVGYEVVEASKDPYFIENLKKEINKNLTEVNKEQEIEFKKQAEEQNLFEYMNKYSLNKLLTLTSVALTIGGLIESSFRQTFISEVKEIMGEIPSVERSMGIEKLINNKECENFKNAFMNMEDM